MPKKLIYIPAVSVGALFSGMTNDLRFRDGTTVKYYHDTFFKDIRYPFMLITGGHYFKKDNITKDVGLFDKGDEFVFGDSGGFQIATGALKYTPEVKEKIFNWLENNSTVAANLDIPPFGVYKFNEALDISLTNFDYFQQHQSGKTKYLNVIQGNDLYNMNVWFQEVKNYKFHGWAVNVKGNSFEKILTALAILVENEKLSKTELQYVHFFGTSKIDDIILITYIQKLFDSRGYNVQFTIDSSSPCSARFGTYYFGVDYKKNIVKSLHYPKIRGANLDNKLHQLHTIGDLQEDVLRINNSNYLFLQNPLNKFDKYIPQLYNTEDLLEWTSVTNALVTIHNIYDILQSCEFIDSILETPYYIQTQFFSEEILKLNSIVTDILFNTEYSPTSQISRFNTFIRDISRNAPNNLSHAENSFF